MISLSVEAGRELEDLAPVLGLLDLKKEESGMDDGKPGQGGLATESWGGRWGKGNVLPPPPP